MTVYRHPPPPPARPDHRTWWQVLDEELPMVLPARRTVVITKRHAESCQDPDCPYYWRGGGVFTWLESGDRELWVTSEP